MVQVAPSPPGTVQAPDALPVVAPTVYVLPLWELLTALVQIADDPEPERPKPVAHVA